MARRGRPSGLIVNGAAVEDLLVIRRLTKSQLCSSARVSPGHLADMLHRAKGGSPNVIERLAAALECSAATLAPELSGFTHRRTGATRPPDDGVGDEPETEGGG